MIDKKKFRSALLKSLPQWVFERLQNLNRRRRRGNGCVTEIFFSGLGKTKWINGVHRFECRPNNVDSITFHQVFCDQEYNVRYLPHGPAILRAFRDLGDFPLIIDCGANIGASAVFFSESFPNAKIVAIEPDSGNFAQMRQNLADFPNVECLHAAISCDDGWMKIANPEGDPNSFRAEESENELGSVRAYSIPSLLDRVDAHPFLLKVDIEGGEDSLFSKHWEILDRFPVVAVEIHDWLYRHQATSRNFLKWHVQGNRDLVSRGEMLYSISNDLIADGGSKS